MQPPAAIVAVPLGAASPSAGVVLTQGADFYSDARRSAPTAGSWRGCSGTTPTCPGTAPSCGWPTSTAARAGAGARRRRPDESIFQPAWSPDGVLLLRLRPHRLVEPLPLRRSDAVERRAAMDGRVRPAAVELRHVDLRLRSARAAGRAPTARGRAAGAWLCSVDTGARCTLDALHRVRSVPTSRGAAYAGCSSADRHAGPPSVVRLTSRRRRGGGRRRRVARRPLDPALHLAARGRSSFRQRRRLTAHAFYYPPTNSGLPGARRRDAAAAGDEPRRADRGAIDALLDPRSSSGPAAASRVVDVNYGGSSGYGRAYRQRLQRPVGRRRRATTASTPRATWWRGAMVDRERLIIRGGSAGGYTTLRALTFHDDVSRPAPATTASATSRRWRATRTSSSRATSSA